MPLEIVEKLVLIKGGFLILILENSWSVQRFIKIF